MPNIPGPPGRQQIPSPARAPDRGDASGRLHEALLAGADPVLHRFASALLAKTPQYLGDFLNTLNDADATIQPARYAHNPQVPVLVGQPLAIARGVAWLELMGAPATNESWDAFAGDLARNDGSRTTNGYEQVRLPLLLGNVLDPDDGLVGFFIEGGATYDTFHTIGPDRKRAGFSQRRLDTLLVNAAGDKVTLTMLIDPSAEIHVTSDTCRRRSSRSPPPCSATPWRRWR